MIFCCPKAPKRPIWGSGTGSNLVLLQRFLPQDVSAAPGAQGSSDQSQVVCMVLFSVQVQGSIVGLGLCTGTKKWFNKKIEILKYLNNMTEFVALKYLAHLRTAFSRKYFS